MRRLSFIPAALIATALLLAGCGSSGGSDSASKTTAGSGGGSSVAALTQKAGLSGKVNTDDDGSPTATVTGKTLEVELNDFYFGPAFIEAKPGTTFTAELRNEGKASHTFTIDSLHIDTTVAPGKSATVTVKVPATGALRMYCKFHAKSGMQGALLATS